MTEQEIISYLKENRTKGVAFIFMPKDVQNWCNDHRRDERTFMLYNGIWIDLCQIDGFDARHVYSLLEDYEPKPRFKPHWQEFNIDEEGNFTVLDEIEDHEFHCINHWSEWSMFLANNNERFNAFGGWLYENSDEWHLSPCVMDIDRQIRESYYMDNEDTVTPAYPKKIRFWRHAE